MLLVGLLAVVGVMAHGLLWCVLAILIRCTGDRGNPIYAGGGNAASRCSRRMARVLLRLQRCNDFLEHGFCDACGKLFYIYLAALSVPMFLAGTFLGVLVIVGQWSKDSPTEVLTAVVLMVDVLFKVVATSLFEGLLKKYPNQRWLHNRPRVAGVVGVGGTEEEGVVPQIEAGNGGGGNEVGGVGGGGAGGVGGVGGAGTHVGANTPPRGSGARGSAVVVPTNGANVVEAVDASHTRVVDMLNSIGSVGRLGGGESKSADRAGALVLHNSAMDGPPGESAV